MMVQESIFKDDGSNDTIIFLAAILDGLFLEQVTKTIANDSSSCDIIVIWNQVLDFIVVSIKFRAKI